MEVCHSYVASASQNQIGDGKSDTLKLGQQILFEIGMHIEHRSSFPVAFNFDLSISSLKCFIKSEPDINVKETSFSEDAFRRIFFPYVVLLFYSGIYLYTFFRNSFIFSPTDIPHDLPCWIQCTIYVVFVFNEHQAHNTYTGSTLICTFSGFELVNILIGEVLL